MLEPSEEIRFWTGIMRDHGNFILSSLSFNEQEAIQCANYYKEAFSNLHEQSKKLAGTKDSQAFNALLRGCMNLLVCFISFKRMLLGRLLECRLNTSLPPTFYNHMINEALEFYKALVQMQNNLPADTLCENLNLHKIWLPDAAGHAATIASDLDPVEKMLIMEAKEFEKAFNSLTIKTDELSKMIIRTCLGNRALLYLNEEVKKKIEEFICYLCKIRDLTAECKVLGVVKPVMADHMMREENYYLDKIAGFMK